MSTMAKIHNVRILGQGRELVVLSHGFGASQGAWEGLLPHLLPRYSVLLYDLRGHGGATSDDDFDASRYRSMEGFAEDLIAILSELQLGKCLYVGHSMSGLIGCLAAAARPDLFSKLVLLGASPRYINDAGYEGGFEQQDVDELLAAIKRDHASWLQGFAPAALGPEASEECIQRYMAFLSVVKPDFMLLIAETIFKSDLRKVLSLVTVPCHVIQTKEDFAVPQAVAKYLHQQLGGELEILDARGHLPHVTHPQILAPVLTRLLSEE
ncbi:hypothetical protein SELMODRAFT_267235 [Selaginella moellendorffii]|uniref:AB hydrolase-1 domain-containing protein n=1 Tax=Selaginella moellendorffii TaxID=88036 RepID=D8RD57_SELML|nr:probable esterase D14L [Selaginella moellendorffii]XP_002973924.1 probable esterase D14L [Selaginella moellendorffii]EFJ24879.1 hypothetical protein SELMODRAFT_149517 [Selaginella moellendorffii]EFJ30254.1 hypothetical protein SELMODRAFT_267235 [Selaginella moellendorffii]|eukprot:XP_002969138.1 probable esterase D14L [Selaginella moellendorffii]